VIERRADPIVVEYSGREKRDFEAQGTQEDGERAIQLVTEASTAPLDKFRHQRLRLEEDLLSEVDAQVLERNRQEVRCVQQPQAFEAGRGRRRDAKAVQVRTHARDPHPAHRPQRLDNVLDRARHPRGTHS